MAGTLATAALTSTLFLSSVFTTPPTATPGAGWYQASHDAAFTQAMPENNYVLHTVDEGESLASIAKNYYGSDDYWTNIWNDNPWIGNPDTIEKDWLVKIQADKPKNVEDLQADLQKKWDAIQAEQASSTGEFLPSPPPSPLKGEGNITSGGEASVYDEVYKAAGAKFGVPWQILYGIHMTETGGRNGAIASGYGSGAEGPMQFMRGTFAAYATDGDGDGKPDIDNATDAIFTAANYLAKHGDLMNGLRSYGGNISGTLALAKQRGYSL